MIAAWEFAVRALGVASYILPAPSAVATALWSRPAFFVHHAGVTGAEILIGLALGIVLGGLFALTLAFAAPLRRWLMPVLVVSQALPVFAIAPLLVIWLGYGMASKIAMTVIIIFFPVTAAFYDGLRRTDPSLLDLARLSGAAPLRTLMLVRVPSALPALASGLRVAAAAAPIGAVVGEWVGASAGLGFVMLNANARAQTDTLFAALLILALMAAALWYAVDAALVRLIHWLPERRPATS